MIPGTHQASKAMEKGKTIIERMIDIYHKVGIGNIKRDGSVFDAQNLEKAQGEIKALAELLKLTPVQVVILTALMERSGEYQVDRDDLVEDLGIDYLTFLNLDVEMDGLRKKRYMWYAKDGGIILCEAAVKALKSNTVLKEREITGLGTMDIVKMVDESVRMMDGEMGPVLDVEALVEQLSLANPGTSFTRACDTVFRKVTDTVERFLFVFILLQYVLHYREYIGWDDLDGVLPDSIVRRLSAQSMTGSLELQQAKMAEYGFDGGFRNTNTLKISNGVLQEALGDIGGLRPHQRDIAAAKKLYWPCLKRKKLFYNESVRLQVTELSDALSEESYGQIRERLRSKGFRNGLTVLFYGPPGTGKTETVYQLARHCHRDVFLIEASRIKSSLVGDSEKNIKEIFDSYRQIVNEGGNIPILLFNEADGIFGARMEGRGDAVDKMENTIQNIILQEMEDLDGILIATTNLTSNLDRAFNRRFLYKIHFEKPDMQNKALIWNSMMPELTNAEAMSLARDYDFSGGQIENIVRKKEISEILTNHTPSLSEIRNYCDNEILSGDHPRSKIGF